jgi:hypothetical protein
VRTPPAELKRELSMNGHDGTDEASEAFPAGPATPVSYAFDDAGSTDPEKLRHTCGGCPARWSGERTSHCGSGCHRTFTGVGNFDAHRSGGRCLDPAEIGLVLATGRAYEAWGTVRE